MMSLYSYTVIHAYIHTYIHIVHDSMMYLTLIYIHILYSMMHLTYTMSHMNNVEFKYLYAHP
jgi:hypothetical protein